MWHYKLQAEHPQIEIIVEPKALIVGEDGNIYLSGIYATDLVCNAPNCPDNLALSGYVNMFVWKVNPAGECAYLKGYGGTGMTIPEAMVTDSDGNLYLSGRFSHTAVFQTEIDIISFTTYSGHNGFIAKFSSDGVPIWAKQFAGYVYISANFLRIDSGGVYVAGRSTSFQMDVDLSPDVVNFVPDVSQFLYKLDFDGETVWFRLFPSGSIFTSGLVSDEVGDLFLFGSFNGSFQIESGFPILQSSQGATIIIKITPQNEIIWAKNFGNTTGPGLTPRFSIDQTGQLYGIGWVNGTISLTTDTNNPILIDSIQPWDQYIISLDNEGDYLWHTVYENSYVNQIQLANIYATGNGEIYTTGTFTGQIDFDPTDGVQNIFSGLEKDIFITVNMDCASNSLPITIESCTPFTSLSGITYISSGDYAETFTNVLGCDSTVNYTIIITPPTFDSTAVTACEPYFWPISNEIYEVSGDYHYQEVSPDGCVNNYFISLEIGNPYSSTELLERCEPFVLVSNGQLISQSGSYEVVLQTALGCDSTLNYVVTIINFEIPITITESTLATPAEFDSYQWVDCAREFEPLLGENGPVFEPASSGFFALIASSSSCAERSSCFQFLLPEPLIRVFPNPTIDFFIIDFGKVYPGISIRLHSELGQLFAVYRIEDARELRLGENLAAGVYVLTLLSDNGFEKKYKLVKI